VIDRVVVSSKGDRGARPRDPGELDATLEHAVIGEVMVVGPGARFLSGISYHTASIVRSFWEQDRQVSALLIHRLCPERAYPGRHRVARFNREVLALPDEVDCIEALNWYWGRSLLTAFWFVLRRRPQVMLLQWWTSLTLHSYLVLVLVARLIGTKIIIEMHEITDPGEGTLPLVPQYSRLMMNILGRHVDAVVVHSAGDEKEMSAAYPSLQGHPTVAIFPGPLHHDGASELPLPARRREPGEPVRFLFFGVMRPYKGIDELSSAFTRLLKEGHNVHLTMAGEPWQDAEQALARVRSSGPDRHRVIDRYLEDSEVLALFRESDVVVVPYRRASASGPVNLTMATGLPLVTTAVPALAEAYQEYLGVEVARPEDEASLFEAMIRSLDRVGERYANPHSWAKNVGHYAALAERIAREGARPRHIKRPRR
jgi:glycosyltransferase involved in cell wall biosynthesis